jgi:hypothetical protein
MNFHNLDVSGHSEVVADSFKLLFRVYLCPAGGLDQISSGTDFSRFYIASYSQFLLFKVEQYV